MFRSLLYRLRLRPTAWRRRFAWYRFSGARDDVVFFAVLATPLLILGLIGYFAYSARSTIDGSRIDAARQRVRDLRCLAENIYFEARGEPLRGQYAVAEVTMNRMASPHFPDTLCEVVHDRRWDTARRRLISHFSWTGLDFLSRPSGPAWDQAMQVATAVYDKKYIPVVPDALFYHATSVQPYWADSRRVVAKIGNHVFYR